MASGTVGDLIDGLRSRERVRWTENSKVYTRRFRKKTQKLNDTAAIAITSAADEGPVVVTTTAVTEALNSRTTENQNDSAAAFSLASNADCSTVTTTNHENINNNVRKDYLEIAGGEDVSFSPQRLQEQRLHRERTPSPTSESEGVNSSQRQLEKQPHHVKQSPLQPEHNASIQKQVQKGRESQAADQQPLEITRVHDRVRFKLSKLTPKNEVRELRQQLQSELVQVRKLVKQLEAKQLQRADYDTNNNTGDINGTYMASAEGNLGQYAQSLPKYVENDAVERRALIRVHSDVDPVGNPESRLIGLARVNSDVGAVRHQEQRLYNRQLSVAVMENHHRAIDFVEKEKRTPKANQYYRNSEFLLGKDRLPPESKRLKASNGRKHGRETEHAFGFGFGFSFGFDKNRNQVFRSCSNLLQRLMKHKHGWVFNEPVDARALGLHDYHNIIKHPMDLGTIKNRLSQNCYKSPREFAEDVRLVFLNAMTYNPKGDGVHIMAEQLSQVFEEKWTVIETEYNPYWRYETYQDAGLPTPTLRKAPQSQFAPASVAYPIPGHVPSVPQMRTLDMSVSVSTPMSVDTKMQHSQVVRTPVPKKPKAKDPNKRDMTYEEKQRLSTNLQTLPSEKLDAILHIIKKRNTTLSQQDDEIEVDIDHVDPETLWELDRFVSNYRKNLSKHKRKAELALQSRAEAAGTTPMIRTIPEAPKLRKESGTGAEKNSSLPPVAQVTLDHLQVIPTVIVPLQLDQMQGSHLGHEWILLRTSMMNVLDDI
ncbi:unnamed protein product [Fraxinus pennsylvanica]|uniref:Transcription factor GTE4 n=1 Tax=Fraxinus pennsylvanica TaxID=56036 RepID=A0AAD1Z3D4_9LAMI|nr:unnamed protein product [Fraxinus pennsylvanica]